jgi:hypothetical protein
VGLIILIIRRLIRFFSGLSKKREKKRLQKRAEQVNVTDTAEATEINENAVSGDKPADKQ